MPSASWASRGALAAEVDARQWAGAALWSENGSDVTAPATWSTFDDVVALLTGRGTAPFDAAPGFASMAYGVAQALTAATAVTVGIDANDRLWVLVAGLGGHFTLAAGAGNAALGFDPAGQTSVTVLGGEYLVATSDWQRGNVQSVAPTVDDGSTSGPLVLPAAYRVHSAVDLARSWGAGDADDAYPDSNLSALGTGRWGIDSTGRVWRARNASGSPTSYALTWVSSSLRAFLGFTGAEVEVTTGGVAVLTATHPCSGLLCPSRPFDLVVRGHTRYGSAVQCSDGSAASSTWLDQATYRVDAHLDGPADRYDRQTHWLSRVRPSLPPGGLVTLYQDWGDPRRAERVGPDAVGYSELYTGQEDGAFGRLLCRRSVDDTNETAVEWPGRVRRRAPLSLRLTEREGGQ